MIVFYQKVVIFLPKIDYKLVTKAAKMGNKFVIERIFELY
jgi:hypothetical protein